MANSGFYEHPQDENKVVQLRREGNTVVMADAEPLLRTPEVVLQGLLAQSDRIRNVVVVVQWDNDQYAFDHSPVPYRDLVFMEKVMNLHVAEAVMDALGDVKVAIT